MTMTVNINRSGKKFELLRNDITKNTKDASVIWEEYGFKHIDALDIKNLNEASFVGIEFNRLLEKNETLYKFVEWSGVYPFDGIIVEEIGTCSRKENAVI